jgi:hypothetical protein
MTRSSVSLSRAAVLSIGLTLLGSSIASAQTPAAAPSNGSAGTSAAIPVFAQQLAGKNVWITAEGARVSGRVMKLSPTSLVLVEDGAPTTIAYDKIVRVEKSTHRLKKGAWIGFASGAALAIPVAISLCDGDCAGWEPVLFSAYYGGLGAAAGVGIGAIVNAAKKNGDVLYDARRKTTTMTLAPILSPTRKGMAFSMTWR